MKSGYVIIEKETGSIMGESSWINLDENSETDFPVVFDDFDFARSFHLSLASNPNDSEIEHEYIYSGYLHVNEQCYGIDSEDMICSDIEWCVTENRYDPKAVPANGKFVSFSGETYIFVTKEDSESLVA